MIKGSIQQEDITFVNIYVPITEASKYVKANINETKERNNNMIIVVDFDTLLPPMDRSLRQKISTETLTLDDMLNQMDLTDMYRIFHPKVTKYTIFSRTHETFTRKEEMLDHKTSLNVFKRIRIISRIFFRPQWYETRSQIQEENWKFHKYVEIKQSAAEQSMGQRRN